MRVVSGDAAGDAVSELGGLSVGFLGAGRMGSAMMSRLLDKGCAIAVFNRTPSASLPLIARGATRADKPADAATPGGVVISMLGSEDATREASLGPSGIVSKLAGGVHVCMGTVSPSFAHEMAQAHAAAGVGYLSAPVQGRPNMAAIGKLVGWVSGPEPGEAVMAIIDALCSRTVRLSTDVRHACAAKLALNFLMFLNVAAVGEALAYVRSLGLDTATVASGMTDTVFDAPLFKAIAASHVDGNYTAQGSDVRITVKDLGLMLGDIDAPGAMPVARRLAQVYRQAVAEGLGDMDPAVVGRLAASAFD